MTALFDEDTKIQSEVLHNFDGIVENIVIHIVRLPIRQWQEFAHFVGRTIEASAQHRLNMIRGNDYLLTMKSNPAEGLEIKVLCNQV